MDRQGSISNNDKAAKWLNEKLASAKFVDVWHYLYPDVSGFTWYKSKPKVIFSRLDYIFVDDNSLQFVNKTKVFPSFKSDHSMFMLSLMFGVNKRGPSFWRLNISLLKDNEYVKAMNKLLDVQLEANVLSKKKVKWEMLKLDVHGSSLQFSARRKKSNRNKVSVLEAKLSRLENELSNVTSNPLKFDDMYEQIRLVKHE